MSDTDETSKHSYSTGTSGAGSSAASDTSDAAALNALQDHGDNDESLNDLLESTRKIDEGVFATLVLLTNNRGQSDIRWVVLRVVFEFLQLFRIVFNTTFAAWSIDKSSWAFKLIQWVLIRGLMLPKGYQSYIQLFYALAAIILFSLALSGWLAVVLKKDDSTQSGWMGRLISALQLLSFVVFTLAWITILDYMVFLFTCKWTALASGPSAVVHGFWGNSCLAMPHLAHMVFAGVVVVIFCATCMAMSVGDCDLNPMTRNVLATPSASVHVKLIICKMAMVVLATCADENPRFQATALILLAAYIWVTLFLSAGFYGEYVLHAWVGLLAGLWYTCLLLTTIVFTALDIPPARVALTLNVRNGLGPWAVGGMLLSFARVWYMKRPLKHLWEAFADVANIKDLKTVYRFRDTAQVEMLSRAMRKWDEDAVPDPEAVAFGDFILKCGLARFPNNPSLLIAFANLNIVAKHDGQAARTQLQLAVKAQPSLLERYFIFATQERSKRLRDESEGLDLMGYIEFQRNYRACVRAHKMALGAQRSLWMTLLHDTIQFRSLQKSFSLMNEAEARASAVYRKVLERYPANGRLLKIYGRFLEYCKNDPWTANKYYIEAMKQGTGESLMALVSGGQGLQALGNVDERQDGLVIINSAGLIMACNKAVLDMFGYEKGELEQKNVSCLMPQPFSGRHNTYLSNYCTTGEARILDSTRNVVGLTKSHMVFPISLTVVKLSGSGDESIFMGAVRLARQENDSVVRIWVTPGSGMILTADEQLTDQFGVPVGEVVGNNFSSLGPDVEALNRLVSDATLLPPEEVHGGKLKCCTQLLHWFLPAVDVEITVNFAGTDAERILVMNIQCVVPAGAVMVVNHKGRIMYATSELATLLGTPAQQLVTMDLPAIVPPPYAQFINPTLFKNMSLVPPAHSCRAGAVVHLLRANGAKVAVTLRISLHDDGDHVQHIVKVIPSSEAEKLDKQRLVLSVGESGTILAVNQGASKDLFGFPPQLLVGRRLSSCINVFRDYQRQHGDDTELLTLLGMRLLDGITDEAWRVGITQPKDENAGEAATTHTSALAMALQQRNRDRPALMTMLLKTESDDSNGVTDAVGDGQEKEQRAALEVVLWQADAVPALLEVDSNLEITRADGAAGLILGVNHRALVKQDFRKLMGLPSSTQATDLLVAAPDTKKPERHQGKKSGLKGGGASKTGVRRILQATHADAAPVKIDMQAATKAGSGRHDHLIMRLLVLDPSCGSLESLLALVQSSSSAGKAAAAMDAAVAVGSPSNGCGLGAGGSDADCSHAGNSPFGVRGRPTRGYAALDNDEDDEMEHEEDHRGRRGHGQRSPPGQAKSARGRVAEWVRQTSGLREDDEDASGGNDGHRPGGKRAKSCKGTRSQHAHGKQRWDDEGEATCTQRHQRRSDADSDEDGDERSQTSAGPAASEGPGILAGDGETVGSLGDAASQQSGAAGQDAASSVVDDGAADDADLVADFRRAKRLKKLTRLFTCSTAQSTTVTLRQRTWILTAIILGAHLAAFSVLVTQIESRYVNAHDTATMARTTDRFQLSNMRVAMIQKCGLPQFAAFDVCTANMVTFYLQRLLANTMNLRNWHHLLYLGDPSSLKQFADPRLYNYWTKAPLPEKVWMDLGNSNYVTNIQNETLWTMGNKFIMNSWDVHQTAPALTWKLNGSSTYNYVRNNGQASIFTGYTWSLDTFVDYSWSSLGQLKMTLIVLLVVETVIVQMTCMVLLALLVRAANRQHMMRFSVFLALPSATLRIMASRQLVVDDDTGTAEDDEELEGLDYGGGVGAASQEEDKLGGAKHQKNVRMAADAKERDGDDAGSPTLKSNTRRMSLASRTMGASEGAKKAPKKQSWQGRLCKLLFGWLDTKVKVNGKKLLPNSTVVAKFMGPLVLWALAVVAIFGVSFTELANLQGPLSSLNAAAHVTYRISRVRLMGTSLAFAETATSNAKYKNSLLAEIGSLRLEYDALLYGGYIPPVNPDVKFDSVAPASTFSSSSFADLFFKTKSCLRDDQTTCFPEGSEFYDITHNGLDAMITRFIDTYAAFANLPDELAYANHTLYKFISDVGGHDMMEGLYKAIDLFEAYTIQRFESVKTLHVILLAISLVIILGFVVLLFRPYVRLLNEESKDIAGLLSQLPAEVAIEELAKNTVIGLPPPRQTGAETLAPGSMPPFGSAAFGPAAFGPGVRGTMTMMGMPGAATLPPGFLRGQVPPGADGVVALHIGPHSGARGSYGAPPAYGYD